MLQPHRVDSLIPNVGCCPLCEFVLCATQRIWLVFVGSTVVTKLPILIVELNVVVLLWNALQTKSAGFDDCVSDGGRGEELVPLELPVEPAANAPPV